VVKVPTCEDVGRTEADLDALIVRYELLEGVATAPQERTPERRDQMRAVASRFPGALRELDAIGLRGVRDRGAGARALREEIASTGSTAVLESPAYLWARCAIELTRRLRAILEIKSWLAEHAQGRNLGSADTRDELRAWYPDADDDLLDRIALPPGGHAQQVAYEDAARALGVEVDELKRTLYGD
jgi:hypothetical protein